ncbi:hypothetical protein [Halobacteriovorax sp. DPLXC-1]|uniref:hypothetical protein n=1 Tax=Halobacteriovorax sp. DPLXC-1 TaxID=3110771 RepID=UPI002FEE84A7
MKKRFIVLLSPRFDKEIHCPVGFNSELFFKGPFSSYFNNRVERTLFLLLAIGTLGVYAYYLASNGNNIKIRKLLGAGYRLRDSSDLGYVERYVGYQAIYSKEGEKVRFARTGSADDTLKLK